MIPERTCVLSATAAPKPSCSQAGCAKALKSDPCHLPLEFVVKKQSRDTARLFGMYDRGTLEPGMRADINLIDFSALQIDTPRMINDLPAGMPRLMQTAQGSVATMVNGETRRENAALTGARPGKFGS